MCACKTGVLPSLTRLKANARHFAALSLRRLHQFSSQPSFTLNQLCLRLRRFCCINAVETTDFTFARTSFVMMLYWRFQTPEDSCKYTMEDLLSWSDDDVSRLTKMELCLQVPLDRLLAGNDLFLDSGEVLEA